EDGAGPADGLLRGDRAARGDDLRRGQLQGTVRGDRARAGPARQPLGAVTDLFDDARAASRQARTLRSVGHRPFPIPESRWTLGQTWEHTFWAHWPVSTLDLRQRVPDELEIEEHDGSGWLSIQFFRVRALRARGALPVPGISAFLQLNVRTYVRGPDGLPGVWFFSIDASSRLAALGGWQDAECVRVGEPGRVFAARYRANGETFHAEPGSLEFFLTERYRL